MMSDVFHTYVQCICLHRRGDCFLAVENRKGKFPERQGGCVWFMNDSMMNCGV